MQPEELAQLDVPALGIDGFCERVNTSAQTPMLASSRAVSRT